MANRRQTTPLSSQPRVNSQDEGADAIYYSRWFNEDALINQRLTWLLLAQALLFTAYGTVATKAVDSCDDKANYLFAVLELVVNVGRGFAIVILVGIGAAIAAQGVLHHERGAGWRKLGVNSITTVIGWLTGLSVPVIFLLAWHYIPRPEVPKILVACKQVAASPTPASLGSASSATQSLPASPPKP